MDGPQNPPSLFERKFRQGSTSNQIRKGVGKEGEMQFAFLGLQPKDSGLGIGYEVFNQLINRYFKYNKKYRNKRICITSKILKDILEN